MFLGEHSSNFIISTGVKRLQKIIVTLISFILSCNDIYFSLILTKYAHYLSDIDECCEAHPSKMIKCHPNASCINTQGSYNCSCKPTYMGSGFECKGTFGFLKLFNWMVLTVKLHLFSAMSFIFLEFALDRLLIHFSHI